MGVIPRKPKFGERVHFLWAEGASSVFFTLVAAPGTDGVWGCGVAPILGDEGGELGELALPVCFVDGHGNLYRSIRDGALDADDRSPLGFGDDGKLVFGGVGDEFDQLCDEAVTGAVGDVVDGVYFWCVFGVAVADEAAHAVEVAESGFVLII